MFAQLGSIEFEPLTSFESFSRTDATTYAQHDLVTVKPRLQAVGNDLEEISIAVKFRAEFKNPVKAILELKAAKDSFEVLPLVNGAGRYFGDYVITSMTEAHNQCFQDGELIEASVNLTLKEYAIPDKLQQQQNAARKQAFAVGEKTPVNSGFIQQQTVAQQSSVNISRINSETKSIDSSAINWENNVSQRTYLESDMQRSLGNITNNLNEFSNRLKDLPQLFSNPAAIQTAIAQMASSVSAFMFPLPSLAALQQFNLALQASNSSLKTIASIIDINVITRKI